MHPYIQFKPGEEPWFAAAASRAEQAELLDGYLSEWISERTSDGALTAFLEGGAPAAPAYSGKDLVADPQVQAVEMLMRVVVPQLGDLLQHNLLYRMSATPGSIRWTGREHAVNSMEFLVESLGIAPERFDDLRDQGVIR